MIFKRNKEVRIPLGTAEWSVGLDADEVDGWVEIHHDGDTYHFHAHDGANDAFIEANEAQLTNLAETINRLIGGK